MNGQSVPRHVEMESEKESDMWKHLPKMVDYLVVDLKCRLKVVMMKIVQVIDLIEDQFCVTAGPC